jgi:hypothetical protein
VSNIFTTGAVKAVFSMKQYRMERASVALSID